MFKVFNFNFKAEVMDMESFNSGTGSMDSRMMIFQLLDEIREIKEILALQHQQHLCESKLEEMRWVFFLGVGTRVVATPNPESSSQLRKSY